MVNLATEVRNKMQKKLSYVEIENIVLRVKDTEIKLQSMFKLNYA